MDQQQRRDRWSDRPKAVALDEGINLPGRQLAATLYVGDQLARIADRLDSLSTEGSGGAALFVTVQEG